MCRDHALDHVAFDISWDEVAKWVVKDEETVKAWGDLINRHSTRFLFGTDAVAPKSQDRHATADVVLHCFRKQETIRKLARWGLLERGKSGCPSTRRIASATTTTELYQGVA